MSFTTYYAIRRTMLACRGALPGRDEVTGDFHALHPRDELTECVGFGLVCCQTCLLRAALGGWTPLILQEE